MKTKYRHSLCADDMYAVYYVNMCFRYGFLNPLDWTTWVAILLSSIALFPIVMVIFHRIAVYGTITLILNSIFAMGKFTY